MNAERSILIDVNSTRFQSQEEIDRFKRFALLKDYIGAKEEALANLCIAEARSA